MAHTNWMNRASSSPTLLPPVDWREADIRIRNLRSEVEGLPTSNPSMTALDRLVEIKGEFTEMLLTWKAARAAYSPVCWSGGGEGRQAWFAFEATYEAHRASVGAQVQRIDRVLHAGRVQRRRLDTRVKAAREDKARRGETVDDHAFRRLRHQTARALLARAASLVARDSPGGQDWHEEYLDYTEDFETPDRPGGGEAEE